MMYFIGTLILLKFFLIWIEQIFSIALSAYIIYLFYKFRHTGLHLIKDRRFSLTLIPIFLLFIEHIGRRTKFILHLFIEACAFLPQIYMRNFFQNKICILIKTVEPDIQKYLQLWDFLHF
ncbi:unnamed protein product (macronuclear) [Paramecium tetraurelia]|uniref:Uncharacterized protein n=1 Tax=Paramecium tetraurelia TaxID=5888 RepID=A0BL29_PARTE|nr:uncharacterized protein GSPATT00029877001 [Paramecium tetraurelia]CAK59246.1 unnamed protein product [Paramecium tetraurelia]|eukprot:XP_001426644.1 hypothetical protein (macronuclear) [Paramecium tetraurelia strain d4-2]